MFAPASSSHSHSSSEPIAFAYRDRTKRDYAVIVKAILYGRVIVSDGAFRTYQVIVDFDWQDGATGHCKGLVYPATETLATIRNITIRTIERHIKELEKAGLLTRQRRRNKTSILYIEATLPTGQTEQGRSDTLVVSEASRETTQLSLAYMDETITTQKLQQADVVVDNLLRLKISRHKAEQLTQRYTPDHIEQKLSLLSQKLQATAYGKPIGDPAAWLIAAIEDNYQPNTGPRATTPPPKPKPRATIEIINEDTNTITIIDCEDSTQ